MLIGEHSAIILTFKKLPFVIKTFNLSIFEWQSNTGFTAWCSYLLINLINCLLLSLQKMIATTIEQFNKIDCVINNAAFCRF